MSGTTISPDQLVWLQWRGLELSATVGFTWIAIAAMTLGSWAVTRRLATGPDVPRWQTALEVLVEGMRDQMRQIAGRDPGRYLPFVGTIFLFILVSNVLMEIGRASCRERVSFTV